MTIAPFIVNWVVSSARLLSMRRMTVLYSSVWFIVVMPPCVRVVVMLTWKHSSVFCLSVFTASSNGAWQCEYLQKKKVRLKSVSGETPHGSADWRRHTRQEWRRHRMAISACTCSFLYFLVLRRANRRRSRPLESRVWGLLATGFCLLCLNLLGLNY